METVFMLFQLPRWHAGVFVSGIGLVILLLGC